MRTEIGCHAAIAALFVLTVAGCDQECGHLDHGPQNNPGDGGGGEGVQVEIGLAGGADGLEFVRLEEGGDIPLETFGQGGTHATVAVRARGLGTNRAFIDITLENTIDGATVMTVPSTRPQLWLCDEAREVCDYLPAHVMTGGLAAPDEKDGLRIAVIAAVRGENGRAGEGRREGVLRQAFDDEDGGVEGAR